MMTDPGREVPLIAGDKTFVLYAGNRALRMLERDTGKTLPDLFASLKSNPGVHLMTTVLHAMLTKNHPELTIDDVDGIIDIVGYDAIGEALGETANRAFLAGEATNKAAGKASAPKGA